MIMSMMIKSMIMKEKYIIQIYQPEKEEERKKKVIEVIYRILKLNQERN
jgi:hypothetical protein